MDQVRVERRQCRFFELDEAIGLARRTLHRFLRGPSLGFCSPSQLLELCCSALLFGIFGPPLCFAVLFEKASAFFGRSFQEAEPLTVEQEACVVQRGHDLRRLVLVVIFCARLAVLVRGGRGGSLRALADERAQTKDGHRDGFLVVEGDCEQIGWVDAYVEPSRDEGADALGFLVKVHDGRGHDIGSRARRGGCAAGC